MKPEDVYRQVAAWTLESIKANDGAIQLAVSAERERCARIAEMPNMAPADIARVIRGG